MRSGRAAQRFGVGRRRPVGCGSSRPRNFGQCLGHRRARVGRLDRVSAQDSRTAAGRVSGVARGRNVVVRRATGARIRARESRRPGHQARLPESALRTRLRSHAFQRRAGETDAALTSASVRLRCSGARGVVASTRVAPTRSPWFQRQGSLDSCLCGQFFGGKAGHAGRVGASRDGLVRGCRVDSTRRRQQGYLGTPGAGRGGRARGFCGCLGRTATARRCPALRRTPAANPLATGGKSLLVRPLSGALRR